MHHVLHMPESMHVQEFQFIEFFSGKANVYRHINAGGYPSYCVDITYLQNLETETNPFDILSTSGLSLLVYI